MADPLEKLSESIYHSYWLIIYNISTCTPICLLIDSSLVDNHPVVLPIIPLSSHWAIAIIYLQSHSHISMYISTSTYTRDGQLLSWSNLLANSESHQTLTLSLSTILVSSVIFIVCFTSKSETENQVQPPNLHQVISWQSDSRRQEDQMALCGRMRPMTTTKKNSYWDETLQDHRFPYSIYPQMVMSTSPVLKPPIKPPSAKSSTKYPPTGVHRPPTPLIRSVCV